MKAVKYILGVLILLFAFKFIDSPDKQQVEEFGWLENYEEALNIGQETEKIIMIDLYADWCAACLEYEKITFRDPMVKKKLEEFVKVKLDFTEYNQFTEEFSSKFNTLGLPVILFLHSNGEEIKNSRINGFLPPKAFLEHLNKVEGYVDKL